MDLMALVKASLIIPIVVGLVEAIKRTYYWVRGQDIPAGLLPALSLVVAEIIALAAIGFSVKGALAGIVGGLAACGLWDISIKSVMEKLERAKVGLPILLIVTVLMITLAPPAFARPVSKMVCDPPTTYEDGSVLAPEEIDEHRFYCGPAPGTYTAVFSSPVCSAQLADVAAGEGDNYCVVRTVAWGAEGGPTNVVVFRRSGTNFFAPPPQGVAPGAGAARLE